MLTVLRTRSTRSTRSGPRAAPVAPTELGEWSRGKLVAALVLVLVLALALVSGVGLWVWLRFHPAPEGSGAPAGSSVVTGLLPGSGLAGQSGAAGGSATSHRDALAAAAMPSADPAAAQPSTLSTRDPGMIAVPSSTAAGPVGIPSGFPHSPEGALAQLAAIDTDVLNTATLDRARQVVDVWAATGGPTGESWSGVKAVAAFLSAAGLSGSATSGLAVRATPMMGLVKATDGPDWVVVCVDFEVDATLKRTGRVAVADCQRMVWDGSRWLLGAGAEPAPAPSIWPGTDVAIDAGWKNLRHA